MKKHFLSVTFLKIFVVSVLLLLTGCVVCKFLPDDDANKTKGLVTVRILLDGFMPPPEQITENSVAYGLSFQDFDNSPGESYDLLTQLLTSSMSRTQISTAAVIQFPLDVAYFSCSYTEGKMLPVPLNVQSGLRSVTISPGLLLEAEPNHQLVVLAFPYGVVPPADKSDFLLWCDLSYQVDPVRDVEVKAIVCGKVTIGGSPPYFLPLCPAVTSFAQVPAFFLPTNGATCFPKPGISDLPHPGGLVQFDLSSVGWDTRFYFPRLSYRPESATEGFGFVNTSQQDAQVWFTAYDPEGTVSAASALFDWPAHNQGAYQAEFLLDLSETTDAWVVAESDQPGLLGFFLSQMFPAGFMSGMDGAVVISDTFTTGVLPRVMTIGDYSTELFLANPGNNSAGVTITGYDGVNVFAGGEHIIAPKGFLRTDVAALFPTKAPFDGALYLQSSDSGLIGNVAITHGQDSLSSANVMPVSQASKDLFAAHITLFPDMYYTELNLFNPGVIDTVVTLNPYNADGSAMNDPFDIPVPAGQVITLRDTELGLPAGIDSDGWLHLTSSATAILGCLTFGNPVDNHYESTLPLQASGSDNIYFAQVANGGVGGVDYFTGISVINNNDVPVDVTIRVHAGNSDLNGEVTRTLQPGEKYVRLLKTIEDIGELSDQASGYIHVTSTSPVFAFVLFGDSGGNFLSAVLAQY